MTIRRPLPTLINTNRLRAGFTLMLFTLVSAACGGDGGDESPSSPTRAATKLQATSAPSGGATPTLRQRELLVREDSPVLGPAEAKVTIVEFLDPECESCRAAHPIVKQLMEEFPKEVRLVVRYFPLHGNSVLAATATEAAGEQGKYEEMQALLFERQPEWGEQKASQEALFVKYASELGLDVAKFTAALDKPEYAAKIERDRADGIALGVTGTPTFFVDGAWVPKPSYGALKAAIESGLD